MIWPQNRLGLVLLMSIFKMGLINRKSLVIITDDEKKIECSDHSNEGKSIIKSLSSNDAKTSILGIFSKRQNFSRQEQNILTLKRKKFSLYTYRSKKERFSIRTRDESLYKKTIKNS
jgi:hypothetical protein